MNMEGVATRSLPELELEVEAEGREWPRQRLQQRLQAEATRLGEVPPAARGGWCFGAPGRMLLRTAAGANS